MAVIHGGPGAPGEMAPVARELASVTGVLEPLQTAKSLRGQVQELRTVLKENGSLPITLIGWSWGAWLSFILAAQYPSYVGKLILIGTPPCEEKYDLGITETRLSRLSQEQRAELLSLTTALDDPEVEDKDTAMAQLGQLISVADSYDLVPNNREVLETRYDINWNVWQQASELRRSGELLELGKKIRCPVVAIHGDYDPHPADGVREPLSRVLKDFKFILLKNCGHCPWHEKVAKDRFYEVLREEIGYGERA